MDQNLFFKWVWRFNALGLALALLALFVVVVVPFPPWRIKPAIESAIEPVLTGKEPPKYVLSLQLSHEGVSDAMLTLEIPPSGANDDPYTSRMPTVVNFLFIDSTTGATRWLFPTHGQVIIPNYEIRTAPGPVPKPVLAMFFNVVEGDPRDFDPNKPATYQFYASKPDGTALTKLLGDLDEAPTLVILGTERIVVSARSKGKLSAVSFSLADFKPLAQTDLSALTPK